MIELNISATGPLKLPANPRANTFGGALTILYTAVNQSEDAYREELLEEQKARASQLAEILYGDEYVPVTDDVSKFHRPTPLGKVKKIILTLTARGRRAQLSMNSTGAVFARFFSPAKAAERQLLDIRLIQECAKHRILSESIATRLIEAAAKYAGIRDRLTLSMAQRALTVLYLRATQCGDVLFDTTSFSPDEDQILPLLAFYNVPLKELKPGLKILDPHWRLVAFWFQDDLNAHMHKISNGKEGTEARDELDGLTTRHLDMLVAAGFLGHLSREQIGPMIEAMHAA